MNRFLNKVPVVLQGHRPRPLWAALAHCLAGAALGDNERHALLCKLFASLSLADRMLCHSELRACKAAQRGETLAEVQ